VSHDLSVAVAVPHLAHVGARVAGLGALDQQARGGLAEAAVGLQRAVVLQPAVLGRREAGRLARQLHAARRHHLAPLEAVQDVGGGVGGV